MPIPTVWPVDAPCNQRFGMNKASYQPNGHTGMDFACPRGTPIRAAAAGTVLWADWAQGLGWPNPYYINPDFTPNDGVDQSAGIVVVIDHGPFVTVYAHLDQTGLNPGDKVALGELIGQVGSTGFSSGPHLHFEVMLDGWNVHDKMFGRTNPELVIGLAPVVGPNERLVGPLGVNGRSDTNSQAPVVRKVVGGTKEVFDRWRNGEVISGIGAWFGDGTAWYWAGGFEDNGVHDLRDDNPVAPPPAEALLPHQRRASGSGAQRRSTPDKNAQAVGERLVGTLNFAGYVLGTDPYGDGNRVWYVGINGGYFWSGSFDTQGTAGLRDLTEGAVDGTGAPAPIPVVPVVPAYDFDLDFLTLNGISVEKLPAHSSNVDTGNFPETPEKAVCHWWNSLEVRPSIVGAISRFQTEGSYASAHFLVDVSRIVQMVSLADRAYHAGAGGNNWVGIEINPVATERGADGQYTDAAKKVQANVRALLVALRERKGYKFALTLHKNVPGAATACSDLDLQTFEIEAPVLPSLPTPPVVVPPVAGLFSEDQAEVLADFAQYLLSKKG